MAPIQRRASVLMISHDGLPAIVLRCGVLYSLSDSEDRVSCWLFGGAALVERSRLRQLPPRKSTPVGS